VWRLIVRHTPLVSIDLLIFDEQERLLLGLRTNEPARGTWFVPGGRILKGETLDVAFTRIATDELAAPLRRADAALRGVYQHLYATNYANEPGTGTHYIVLGHEIRARLDPETLPTDQHSDWRWSPVDELMIDPAVHDNVKDYFR
jgi:colanic acid biosynthesis protein WcaH